MRLAADENFNGHILSGLRRILADLDTVTAQGGGLGSAIDPRVLDWAAAEERVLLTHDERTMPGFAYQRVAEGKLMPGVVVVPNRMSIGEAIEELLLVIQVGTPEELRDRVIRLPL